MKCDFSLQQRKDPNLHSTVAYLEQGNLPTDGKEAQSDAWSSTFFSNGWYIIYFVDSKSGKRKCVAILTHTCGIILKDNHGGADTGHFSVAKLYKSVCCHWWWPTLFNDNRCIQLCKNCRDCAVLSGTGLKQISPSSSDPTPMPIANGWRWYNGAIPTTKKASHYDIVFQDFPTKYHLVFPSSRSEGY